MIGVFSDSHGDLGAFDKAYELLRKKGAKRFFFMGGRYTDLDEWLQFKRELARGGRAYNDQDFLSDIASFLGSQSTSPHLPSAQDDLESEDPARLHERFLRTPERECLAYRDPTVTNKAMDMLGNALVCLVHDKNDLQRDDLTNATVFIHGKESEPKVVQIGPRYFITAGKLTGAAEQTCGLIDVVDKNLRFSAFCLDGRTLVDQQVLVLGGKSKLSLK